MKHDSTLEKALQGLREEAVPSVEDADRAVARRARLVPLIEVAIRKQAANDLARRRSRRWVAFAAVAAAAAFAVLGGGALLSGPSQPAQHASSSAAEPATPSAVATILQLDPGATVLDPSGAPHDGGPIVPGSRVTTSESASATIVTATGVTLTLAASSELALNGGELTHEMVQLSEGELAVDVPAGDRARQFMVVAPLATVVVHGTRFSVSTAGTGVATTTEVEVTEGVVSVLHASGETILKQGGRWRSGPPLEPSASAADTASARAIPAQSSAGAVTALAEQNKLYQEAMNAKKSGDDAGAIQKLDALLVRWPGSPLAEEAKAERARAQTRLGAKR